MNLGRQLDFLARLLKPTSVPPAPVASAPPVTPAAVPPRLPKAPRIKAVDQPLEEKARALLRSVGAGALADRVQVRWNARMRSTAGMAYAGKSLVTLNPRLREFGDEEVDRTLRHELAHLLAHFRVGRRRIAPHGAEWRKACIDLGLPDEKRCHTLPLPRREMTARHLYRCPSCRVEVRRVRPFRRKTACLTCCRQHSRGQYDDRFRFVKVAA